MKSYDYIILGSGASGLMTAYRMSLDGFFDDKNILLIDKEFKDTHDRTWCYWEKGNGEWDHLITKKWENIYFGSPEFAKVIPLGKYFYNMLRSGDFYAYLWNQIGTKKNIHYIIDNVISIDDNGNFVKVKTKSSNFEGLKIINSIFNSDILMHQDQFPYLKQHFVGWFVKTEENVFDENVATFMDFNIHQNGNTRFMYILPMNKNQALVEYTLFSEHLLPTEEYEIAISNYLKELGAKNYVILEKEAGNIPMTSFPLEKQNTKNIIHIGSAGGWTKASTGYTFANTCKKSKELVQFLKTESNLKKFYHRNRYWYFDLIFLGVLFKKNEVGSAIFTSIFKNNRIQEIFQFLDEENNLYNDLKLIFNTSPKLNFIHSFVSNFRLFLFR